MHILFKFCFYQCIDPNNIWHVTTRVRSYKNIIFMERFLIHVHTAQFDAHAFCKVWWTWKCCNVRVRSDPISWTTAVVVEFASTLVEPSRSCQVMASWRILKEKFGTSAGKLSAEVSAWLPFRTVCNIVDWIWCGKFLMYFKTNGTNRTPRKRLLYVFQKW